RLTISIARSTPAQKPRGFARTMSMARSVALRHATAPEHGVPAPEAAGERPCPRIVSRASALPRPRWVGLAWSGLPPGEGCQSRIARDTGPGAAPPSGALLAVRALAVEQPEQHDPDRAADHRAVGDVERRPVPVAPMPLDEIDHVAVHLAVDDVAQRAADHQRERKCGAPVAARRLRQPEREQAADAQ